MAKLLLENGAQVDLQKNEGWSALMSASQNGHREVAKLLLENGASVSLGDKSALSAALQCGQSEIGELLKVHVTAMESLDEGFDVDLQSTEWESAMSLDLSQEQFKLIQEHIQENSHGQLNSPLEKVCSYL